MGVSIRRFKKFNILLKIVGTLTTFFIFSSCATLNLTMPVPELESPQHHGRQNGVGFEVTGGSGSQLSLTDDPSKRPFIAANQNQKVDDVFIMKPGINWYALSRLTVTAGVVDSKSPFLRAKISLLNGYREDTEIGRYQMSFTTEASFQHAETSGNQNGAGGAVGFPWKGTSQLLYGKASLSFGMQMTRKMLPFIGYSYQQFQTYGVIDQTAAGSDAGGSFKIQPEYGTVQAVGLGLDWKISPRFYIMPQALYYQTKWYDKSLNQIGGSLRLIYVPIQ